ncbi:hypothetical protein PLICRDRAFT_466019 [Plicaturopsis crispa FD-325 SS-3]|nr:hypothetical protein PLICRDRAFT_466019 [Plicaturopsis crispa FD-325 SS-3]
MVFAMRPTPHPNHQRSSRCGLVHDPGVLCVVLSASTSRFLFSFRDLVCSMLCPFALLTQNPDYFPLYLSTYIERFYLLVYLLSIVLLSISLRPPPLPLHPPIHIPTLVPLPLACLALGSRRPPALVSLIRLLHIVPGRLPPPSSPLTLPKSIPSPTPPHLHHTIFTTPI